MEDLGQKGKSECKHSTASSDSDLVGFGTMEFVDGKYGPQTMSYALRSLLLRLH